MGFFNPQYADQALSCMEMMDFEGKDMVMQRIAQNGTMFQQLQQMQMQMEQMAALMQAAGLVPPMAGAADGQPISAETQTRDDPVGRAVKTAEATQADTARVRAVNQAGV